jgi:hypothetical protein
MQSQYAAHRAICADTAALLGEPRPRPALRPVPPARKSPPAGLVEKCRQAMAAVPTLATLYRDAEHMAREHVKLNPHHAEEAQS